MPSSYECAYEFILKKIINTLCATFFCCVALYVMEWIQIQITPQITFLVAFILGWVSHKIISLNW